MNLLDQVSTRGRLLVTIGCVALLWGAAAAPAIAHPLGNFTVNTYAGLRVAPDVVAVDFVLDLAEVATLQARQYADDDLDGEVGDAEWSAYAEVGCRRWSDEIELLEDGSPLSLQADGSDHRLEPGEGGAPTLRVECTLTAARRPGEVERRLTFSDRTFPDRRGWREVTAVGDRTTLVSSTVPAATTSDRLHAYPEEGLDDPIDVRSAEVVVAPGGPPVPLDRSTGDTTAIAGALGAGSWALALDDVVAGGLLGEGLAAVAALAALALGALHALAPGHGKTVMAAYLVGQRGALRHAAALALSVALTHTAGVLVLGAALWTASVAAPERLYPILGAVSGGVIVAVGIVMLSRQRGGHHAHEHHTHDHHTQDHRGQSHHDQSHHGQGGSDHPTRDGEPLRARTLVALGFAGGLVPTPTALLVLLGALTAGRVWVGVALVACYGVGMALALVAVGLGLSHARGRLDERLARVGSGRLHAVSHALPRFTAAVVTMAGAAVIVRSVL